MSLITIPVVAAQNGGNLYTLVDDLTNLNSEVSRLRQNDDLLIDDIEASVSIEIDETLLLSILAEGGEVEQYLFAVNAPLSLGVTPVPAGVPYRDNAINEVKQFKDWFLFGSELWINNTTSRIIFYSNPLGAQADISQYLKGSEVKLIKDVDSANINILTLDEAQAAIVADPDFVKVVW